MIDVRNHDRFYGRFFPAVEQNAGVKLDPETLALRTIAHSGIFVTSELAMYPEQHISAEGLLH